MAATTTMPPANRMQPGSKPTWTTPVEAREKAKGKAKAGMVGEQKGPRGARAARAARGQRTGHRR
jgi:hypothetical protein